MDKHGIPTKQPLTATQTRQQELQKALAAVWDVAVKLAHQVEAAYTPPPQLSDEECKSAILFSEAVLRTAICEAVRVQMLAGLALEGGFTFAKECWRDSRGLGQCGSN